MENEEKYISLMSDYGFKVAFADESDTLFLRKALQAVLDSPNEIKEVAFNRNEKRSLIKTSRGGVYDISCVDENGNTFIVEMQLGDLKNFIHRAKFYTFLSYNIMVKKGEYKFDNLTPIYCISFVALELYPNLERYYHYCTLKNQEGEEMDRQIVHIIIEISKFDKTLAELETDLDKLIYVMKNTQQLTNVEKFPYLLDEEWITRTMEKLETANMTATEYMHYGRTMARTAMEIDAIKREREEAVEEARKETAQRVEKETAERVEKETAKRVRKETAQKVRKEEEVKRKNEALKMAKKLKQKGMSLPEIAELVDLSQAELERQFLL